jgi:HK97 family phage portal protein
LVESRTASGLVVESRAAFPRDDPNTNDPADVPPATVGPEVYNPGDPIGIELVIEPGSSSGFRGPPRPQPWSGWPAEWQTPNWWNRLEVLTDTAWGCLDLNSSVLSTMPPYLVGASTSLPTDWLVNPDPLVYGSWAEFAKQLFWDFQMGEAFVLATAYYSNLYPARFHVVPPWLINAELDGDGLRRYAIGGLDVTDDVLHIRYKSTVDDARGHGPLEAGSARLIAAEALVRYATDFAVSGGVPHSVLTHPQRLTAKQASDLVWQWVDARLSAMGLSAVLSGGIDFKTIAADPEKMALVDLSKFTESRVAWLLGVPPHLAALPAGGDPMTYTNTQWLFLFHWRAGLSPKASTVMQALSQWLTPRGTTIELNRDEYVKPDLKERGETWAILHGIVDPETGEQVLSVEEIRELERFSKAAPSETLTSGVLQ